MNLSGKQLNYLRSLAHHKKPVVFIGSAGLSDGVLAEIETALSFHELVKIKIGGTDKTGRKKLMQDICDRTNAAPVQSIGNMAVLYRPAEKPKITLP